jgi:lipoprotein-anchoring transpeptidase ErfK/SrfK
MRKPESPQPRPARRMTPWAVIAATLAVLVPGVPLLIGVFLQGASPRAATVQTTRTTAYTPVGGGGGAGANHHRPSARAAAHQPLGLPAGQGAVIAYVSRPIPMRTRPGGRVITVLQRKTAFGSPTYVLVRHVRDRWLGVITTAAGNNRIGWIPAAGVELARDGWSIHAHLSRHLLDVYHDGRLVRHFRIATGKPSAPTPTGLYAVTDRLTTGDPAGPYGCCILALSAKAPHHIADWTGGNRIAIHSTPETSSIGYSVSHGCMRLTLAEGQWLIRHIPLATPVRISSA